MKPSGWFLGQLTGLGSVNENLPGFIVLALRHVRWAGAQNWRSAFLPGAYQGTHINTRYKEIEKLIENIRNSLHHARSNSATSSICW